MWNILRIFISLIVSVEIAFSGLFIGLPYYSELLVAQFLQENIYGIWDYNPSINLSLTEFTPYLLISFLS